ncbi:unnamed protein product [Dovyalis caffra]|uniref:Uncharacterized protein n=1 Tax=Dovyalis caffra TaxID=77055 RepID=A0AAV1SMX8_9ROSI|nr:unnamed protein product [Dovyalis caffra]
MSLLFAIEEIATMVVPDTPMLASKEVFFGKGYIKEETELTLVERKRRRASKERKFKVELVKMMAKKARENTTVNHDDGKEE